MLARLAAALQRGQIQAVGGQGFGGGGGTIIVDDNCLVSWPLYIHTIASKCGMRFLTTSGPWGLLCLIGNAGCYLLCGMVPGTGLLGLGT